MNLDLRQYVESFDTDAESMSDQIWEFVELRFEEKQSSKLQADYLEAQGFHVQRGIAGIPTEAETREKIQKDFRKVRGTEAYDFPVASPSVC